MKLSVSLRVPWKETTQSANDETKLQGRKNEIMLDPLVNSSSFSIMLILFFAFTMSFTIVKF